MIHKFSVLLFTFVALLAIFQPTDAASRIPQPTTDSTLVLKIFCVYNYNIINKNIQCALYTHRPSTITYHNHHHRFDKVLLSCLETIQCHSSLSQSPPSNHSKVNICVQSILIYECHEFLYNYSLSWLKKRLCSKLGLKRKNVTEDYVTIFTCLKVSFSALKKI